MTDANEEKAIVIYKVTRHVYVLQMMYLQCTHKICFYFIIFCFTFLLAAGCASTRGKWFQHKGRKFKVYSCATMNYQIIRAISFVTQGFKNECGCDFSLMTSNLICIGVESYNLACYVRRQIGTKIQSLDAKSIFEFLSSFQNSTSFICIQYCF